MRHLQVQVEVLARYRSILVIFTPGAQPLQGRGEVALGVVTRHPADHTSQKLTHDYDSVSAVCCTSNKVTNKTRST